MPPETAPSKANPFTETVVSEYFVGREPEISAFRSNLQGLREGRPVHELVAGLHGTGKTFYLFKLAEIAKLDGFIGVYSTLDANVDAHAQLSSILAAIISCIHAQCPDLPPGTDLMVDWNKKTDSKLFRCPHQAGVVAADGLRTDFETLANYLKAGGRDGAVICIDEGQRIDPSALSTIKNSLATIGTFMVVLSLRVVSDARGAVHEGRALLEERASAAEGDIGAARFFTRNTPMGAFKTEDEVIDFFSRRTATSGIKFSERLALKIGSIADRVPHEMIRVSSKIFDRAAMSAAHYADMPLLTDSLPELYPTQMQQAAELAAEVSDDLGNLVAALCAFDMPATARQIIDHAYGAYPEDVRALLADGAEKQLDRLCSTSALVKKNESLYQITSSINRYALQIVFALGG